MANLRVSGLTNRLSSWASDDRFHVSDTSAVSSESDDKYFLPADLYTNVQANTNLEDLGDTTISSVATGAMLKWNGTAWVNSASWLLDASEVLTFDAADDSQALLVKRNAVNNLSIDTDASGGKLTIYRNGNTGFLLSGHTALFKWGTGEDLQFDHTNATGGFYFTAGGTVQLLRLENDKLSFFDAAIVAQQTTGVAEAAFVENSGGTAVNVDSTFGGYTLQQIAQALQNYGLLA